MKRLLMFVVLGSMLALSAPVQAQESDDFDRNDPEATPGTEWAWLELEGIWCRVAEVSGGLPEPGWDPLLGIVEVDPDDCWIIIVKYVVGSVTLYHFP